VLLPELSSEQYYAEDSGNFFAFAGGNAYAYVIGAALNEISSAPEYCSFRMTT
jgi:hypothetical protein